MKFLLLLTVLLAFTSCEKDDYCWTCETTFYTTYSDRRPADTTVFTSQECNRTASEIEDYEESGSYSTTITSGGVTQTTRITVNCTR